MTSGKEKVEKRLVIGMTPRPEWEKKISSFLLNLTGRIGLATDGNDQGFLAELACGCSNLIYAGILLSLEFSFNGETVVLNLVYYPGEDEEDDLDLSILSVVDWEADVLEIRMKVEDRDFARQLAGDTLGKASGRFSLGIEGPVTDMNEEEDGHSDDEKARSGDDQDSGEKAGEDGDRKKDDGSAGEQKKSKKKAKKEDQ